jgi:hypothetical protein
MATHILYGKLNSSITKNHNDKKNFNFCFRRNRTETKDEGGSDRPVLSEVEGME